MVSILVTGSNGQLGSELRAVAGQFPYYSFIFTDVDELDITDYHALEDFFQQHEPDVIINCAGYTAVDKAEEKPEKAMRLNRDAVANLARICNQYECYLVHFSTDYVFDGKKSRPYREDDAAYPISAYGRTKLAGEEAMMSCLDKGLIIRTSWLYSAYGKNFIKTILNRCKNLEPLTVVSDQFGTPTYARDLAVTILRILPESMATHKLEIFNYSNEGECSWYEFASEAIHLSGYDCTIKPVITSEYKTAAPRPAYSVLDKSKIKERFGIIIPEWRESLKDCIGLMAGR